MFALTFQEVQEIIGDEDLAQACKEAVEQLHDDVANNRPASIMLAPRVEERRRNRHEKTINAVVDHIYQQNIMFAPCLAETMDINVAILQSQAEPK